MLAIFDHLYELLFLKFLASFSISLYIIVDIDSFKLGWHAFIKNSIHKIVILLRQGPFPIVLFLCKIQTYYVTTVLLEKPGKVFFCTCASLIDNFVNDNVGFGCKRAWSLGPKKWDRSPQLNV